MAVTPRPFSSEDPAIESRRPGTPVRLECRWCGYEADDPIVPPTVCPKCHGSTWQRSGRRPAPERPQRR